MINLLLPWALPFLSDPPIAILLRNRIYIDVVTDQLAAEGLVCGASGVAEIAKFSWKPPSLLIVFSETTTLIQKYWNIFILSNLTEISSEYITIIVNLDHSHILLWRKSFIYSWRSQVKGTKFIVTNLQCLLLLFLSPCYSCSWSCHCCCLWRSHCLYQTILASLYTPPPFGQCPYENNTFQI